MNESIAVFGARSLQERQVCPLVGQAWFGRSAGCLFATHTKLMGKRRMLGKPLGEPSQNSRLKIGVVF